MKKYYLIVLAMIVLLSLVACTTKTQYSQVRGTPTAQSPQIDQAQPIEQPAAPTPKAQTEPQVNKELAQFLENPPTSKVTYRLRSSITYEGKTEIMESAQTVVIDGKDQKIQTETTYEGQTQRAEEFFIGGQYSVCQEEEVGWMCYAYPQLAPKDDQAVKNAFKKQLADMQIKDAGTREILQVTTHCYAMALEDPENPELNGERVNCYGENGILFYSQTKTPAMETTLQAQQYSQQVNPQEFILPAEAQPLPLPEQ